jgi:hypothetical protein
VPKLRVSSFAVSIDGHEGGETGFVLGAGEALFRGASICRRSAMSLCGMSLAVRATHVFCASAPDSRRLNPQ